MSFTGRTQSLIPEPPTLPPKMAGTARNMHEPAGPPSKATARNLYENESSSYGGPLHQSQNGHRSKSMMREGLQSSFDVGMGPTAGKHTVVQSISQKQIHDKKSHMKREANEKAKADIMCEEGIKTIQESIQVDGKYNTLETQFIKGNWAYTGPTPKFIQSSNEFVHKANYKTPTAAVQFYKDNINENVEHCNGLLPEIQLAYLSIGNEMKYWSYGNRGSSTIIGRLSLDGPIKSVGLTKVKKEFIDKDTEYMVLIASNEDIYFYQVQINSRIVLNKVEDFIVGCRDIEYERIVGAKNGRVFIGCKGPHLNEVQFIEREPLTKKLFGFGDRTRKVESVDL